jgi:hypothetical protein
MNRPDTPCARLQYDIDDRALPDIPAVLGNGRMQCMASPAAPVITDLVAYGYGRKGIRAEGDCMYEDPDAGQDRKTAGMLERTEEV